MNRLDCRWMNILLIFTLVACTSYESRVVPFKMPAAYPNATEVAGAVIAAQSYADKTEAEEAFGFDIRSAGVLPVKVIFDNRGDQALDIVARQTFLVDSDNNLWPILNAKMAYDRIEKKTELGKVVPEGAKYGALAGIAGGVIGAAIGIVSRHNVGDAAMKGAAIGAAAGITLGGSKGLSDQDVKEKIRSDLDGRSLENRPVRTGEIAYGFVFFPGEAKKPVELRLQLRAVASGKIYTLIMKL